MSHESAAENQGWWAFKGGKRRSENPHQPGTNEHKAWDRGYRLASQAKGGRRSK